MIVFGFLFVTVASRISGLIGNSSNPVSGMTIATLMATCAMFLVAFARAIRGEAPYPITGEDLVNNIAILEAIIKSAAGDGAVVSL